MTIHVGKAPENLLHILQLRLSDFDVCHAASCVCSGAALSAVSALSAMKDVSAILSCHMIDMLVVSTKLAVPAVFAVSAMLMLSEVFSVSAELKYLRF